MGLISSDIMVVGKLSSNISALTAKYPFTGRYFGTRNGKHSRVRQIYCESPAREAYNFAITASRGYIRIIPIPGKGIC